MRGQAKPLPVKSRSIGTGSRPGPVSLRRAAVPNRLAAVPFALSTMIKVQSPRPAAQAVAEAVRRVPHPSGALVFTSGSLGERLPTLAEDCAALSLGTPALLVNGAGVLTERGELEGDSAAAVLVWSGGETEVCALSDPDLATAQWQPSKRAPSALGVFLRSDAVTRQSMGLDSATSCPVFGAGAIGDPGVFAIDAAGRISTGAGVAMLIRGLVAPRVKTSPGCRLLMPLRRITQARGPLVLEIEGEPALDVLGSVAGELSDQPLVFAVLAEDDDPEAGRPDLLVRPVHGVDPARKALVISEEARAGMRLSFAIKDSHSARADLEGVSRELLRELAGAAPRFGIYLNCAGRGTSLHGVPDADTRILRGRFGALPIAGMQSAFEIATGFGKPALQLYTGVLTVFTAPS